MDANEIKRWMSYEILCSSSKEKREQLEKEVIIEQNQRQTEAEEAEAIRHILEGLGA